MSEHPIDAEAIAASLADPRAFGVIFERHFAAIHGYLRRRLNRQLADELASQTFLVAFDRRAASTVHASTPAPGSSALPPTWREITAAAKSGSCGRSRS